MASSFRYLCKPRLEVCTALLEAAIAEQDFVLDVLQAAL